jgi:hypothetical protein
MATKSPKLQQFMGCWHPAFVGYDPAKSRRSFMLHVRKAVRIALGQKEERLPDILYNPSVREAKEVFESWEDGFACDIETISLKDHRMLSIAVSGEIDLAMVWDLRDVKTRKLLKPLRAALQATKRIVWQNGEFDIPILQKHGYKVNLKVCWDTMVENQILWPDEPVNLSFLGSMHTDMEAWKHLRGTRLLFYNALDANVDWKIYVGSDEHYEEYEE